MLNNDNGVIFRAKNCKVHVHSLHMAATLHMERSIRKWVLWILFYNIKFKSVYGTVHEKIAPLIYYKNVIKMHHVCIAITSQRLTLSTSYFHHFILHHFSTVKCILESWTISVPTFLRAIPPGVQNYHIFV